MWKRRKGGRKGRRSGCLECVYIHMSMHLFIRVIHMWKEKES